MVFPKTIALECDLSCIIWKDGIFFPGKYDIFSLGGKWKMIFLKKYMEICYFMYTCINVTNMILPLCKKNQIWSFLEKNALKGDWHARSHCRKSSDNSLYFYGDLHRRFHILLSNELKTGNLVYKVENWFPLRFIWCKIFYMEEFSILCTIRNCI